MAGGSVSPIAMPEAGRRTNKAKALDKLDKYETESQSVHISMTIKKKVIDGKVVVSATLDRGMTGALPEEFTDMGKFKTLVSETVAGLVDELGGSK